MLAASERDGFSGVTFLEWIPIRFGKEEHRTVSADLQRSKQSDKLMINPMSTRYAELLRNQSANL